MATRQRPAQTGGPRLTGQNRPVKAARSVAWLRWNEEARRTRARVEAELRRVPGLTDWEREALRNYALLDVELNEPNGFSLADLADFDDDPSCEDCPDNVVPLRRGTA
jgi:hypothetical protein